MKEYISKRVHELYWEKDINCARTALLCLSELFEVPLAPQPFNRRPDCMARAGTGRSAAWLRGR